jgi:hypothetical protein
LGASLGRLFQKNDYTDDVGAGDWHKKEELSLDKLNLDRKAKGRI